MENGNKRVRVPGRSFLGCCTGRHQVCFEWWSGFEDAPGSPCSDLWWVPKCLRVDVIYDQNFGDSLGTKTKK